MNINNFRRPFGGMTQWLYQRFTALFMVAYMATISVIMFTYKPLTYEVWASLFDLWALKSATLVFFYLMFFHAWIGVLHVTEDYIKAIYLRKVINLSLLLAMLFELIYLTFFLIGYSYD
jgi:succinate dehydrogenase / fumarate reductase, membrane anchor subunit